MAVGLDEPLGTMATANNGEAALQQLRDTDPALFLSPSADLAAAAREASQHIYSSLAPFSPAQPPPLPGLLAGPAFDAEQIWSQIELLTRPLLPHLRRQLRRLEQQPPSQQQAAPRVETPAGDEKEQSEEGEEGSEFEELKAEEDEELEGSDDEDEMVEDDEENEEELEGKGGNGMEDKFLKTKDLEEFLEQAEEEEYGGGAKRGEKKKAKKNWMEEDSDDDDGEGMEDDEDDEDGEDEDELNVRNL